MLKKFIDTITGKSAREHKRLNEWYAHGETGLSSKAIARALISGDFRDSHAYPHDSGDFMRCQRLLEHMGWEDRIKEMAVVSETWKRLANHWRFLVATFYSEMAGEVPSGTLSTMIRHVETFGTLGGYRPEMYPYHFTGQIDLPGLFCQDRVARKLPLLDERYPVEHRQIGTHRYRVWLSAEAAKAWIADAQARLDDKTTSGKLRSSYKRAVEALEYLVREREGNAMMHRRYLSEGRHY